MPVLASEALAII